MEYDRKFTGKISFYSNKLLNVFNKSYIYIIEDLCVISGIQMKDLSLKFDCMFELD